MVESTEHEAEDVPPASADPEYISMNPTDKECHVNNESLEQADRSGIGHTDGPNPTNQPEVLHGLMPDVAETCMPGLDKGMDTTTLEYGSDIGTTNPNVELNSKMESID